MENWWERTTYPRSGSDQVVLAVHDSHDRLAEVEPRLPDLVNLRSLAGRTLPEAAADLCIVPRTADSWWAYAREWLARDPCRG